MTRFLRALPLVAGLLFLGQAVAAQQGTLTGRITDQAGAPLGQATVAVQGGGGSALADNGGIYRLSLPAGTYDLHVTHVASRGETYYGITVSAGQTTTYDIRLPTKALEIDGFVVTPRRGVQERASEAAPMTYTLSSAQIEERPAPSIADQLRPAPGVDIITQGVQSTNVTVRGFNNIFSGALHMLSDNRLAGVPSLRVNLMHFIPTIEEDVDRIEVVLGPGSALYGPNTANGVVHIITKSPLDEQGTSVSVGGGERSVFQGAFRSAFLLDDDFGVKVSGQYLTGNEWEYTDPTEAAARSAAIADPQACIDDKVLRGLPTSLAQIACERVGLRDFDIERYSFEGRADWRFSDRGTMVGTYGYTNASGVELTGLGAGQTDDWVYQFFQLKTTYDRLFAQIYYNTSDAGQSWLLRDGVPLVDQSTLTVGQIQHGFSMADGRQDFTYGFDYFATRPETGGTVNGTYEANDNMNEWGIYLQSKTILSDQFDFIAALRTDSHSLLPESVWSPRASLVFKPAEQQSLRFSYNRAFSTPSSLNFFLDISGGAAPPPIGPLGYNTRAYGTGSTGYGFQNPDGSLMGMLSPFNPSGADQVLPADPAVAWQLGVGVLAAQGALPAHYIPILAGLSPSSSDVPLLGLDATGNRFAIAQGSLPALPVVEESNTESFELGWTGVFDDRFRIDASGYYMKKNNFVSPLVVQNPLLVLQGEAIPGFIANDFVAGLTAFYVGQGMDPGTALATATAEAGVAIPQIATALGGLPVGVAASDQVNQRGPELVLGYRNVGDIDLTGFDVALQMFLNDEWTATGTMSWVSDDYFSSVEYPIALNAPKAKGTLGLQYRNSAEGFNAGALLRLQKQFPAESAGFVGTECVTGDRGGLFDEECVAGYGLVDVNMGYRIPGSGVTAQLSVSNIFDSAYRSFVGVPAVGRFAMLRLKYDIF